MQLFPRMRHCKSSLEFGEVIHSFACIYSFRRLHLSSLQNRFCCPNQKLCIPKSEPSCLCPHEDSKASDHSNNHRVHNDHECGGGKCEFWWEHSSNSHILSGVWKWMPCVHSAREPSIRHLRKSVKVFATARLAMSGKVLFRRPAQSWSNFTSAIAGAVRALRSPQSQIAVPDRVAWKHTRMMAFATTPITTAAVDTTAVRWLLRRNSLTQNKLTWNNAHVRFCCELMIA